MHIPDGFLANDVALACAIPAIGAVGYGLRRAEVDLDDRRVPLLGVTAAFVFAAQMLNFPVAGGTSGHFLGAALAAILLGPWLASLVLAVVLMVQAFVFADGGITALGANVFNMGVVGGVLVGGLMLAARRALPNSRAALLGVTAGGAWLAVMAGAAACAVELAVSGIVPLATVLPTMLGVHAIIGAGEAVISVAAVSAVLATRPDLIHGPAPAVPVPTSPAMAR
jgi:cobalt/nickel transport system permease protein